MNSFKGKIIQKMKITKPIAQMSHVNQSNLIVSPIHEIASRTRW